MTIIVDVEDYNYPEIGDKVEELYLCKWIPHDYDIQWEEIAKVIGVEDIEILK